ncbi:P2X purinoceptor 7 [Pantherophis guttatus]|uniref:P2X purinoceptor n=1 Tax=Pantherophis guttatus TaxID=94885 RepID=A0A6P9CJN1_PANGU|nr:P2X purinoceptor 7 [Pantherophis guttatus]XP_034284644.1 P2X purinoceptor 7 [Pantherophis guttatus]XP_034284645.1 P2X purinoceptor 7 [Pantherophis guttatus]
MAACSSLRSVFEYETNKVVRIYSVWYGSLKWIIHFMVFLYVSIVLFADRRYQKKDSVISSVHVKVKGVSQTDKRVWDTAEYTIAAQGVNSFFVLTNIITTENQVQGLCPEFPLAKAVCSTDKSCTKGRVDPQGNGIQTGKCVKYNSTVNTCEVSAWCPVESIKTAPKPAILDSAENFTVLIKNNIHFPKFDYTTRNIPAEFNVSCIYSKHRASLCPIFRLGDILQEAGEKFSEVAVQGGIIGIEINWDCNLDKWAHRCKPNYGFRRLDDKRTNEALYPGYNFRFARYYKQLGGREERTLIKAYGIRFDILIFGTAGRLDFFEVVVYIGSVLSYFGLAQVAVDCLLTSSTGCCCKPDPVKEYYYNKKCQEVLGPRSTLFYVTYVDEPGILMIDKLSETSLQAIKGGVIEKRQGDFTQSSQLPYRDRTISPQNAEELQLLQNRREGPCFRERPSWCCCGKCRPADPFWEQLCCRKTDGPCIANSSLFEQLVLSRSVLEFVLLYKDPLLDLSGVEVANKPFRHCAYERYIHWRFGEGDLSARAVIPNCCRWRIRDAFPSENGEYSGFGKKK